MTKKTALSFLVFLFSYALAEAQLPATILKDINPGSGNSLEATYPIQKAWNYVYFVADAQGYNKKLYKTDGTTTNTVLVHSIIKNVRNLAAMGSAITFDGQQNNDFGVFRSSLGTQQTTITLANLGDKQNRFLECIPGGHCFFGVQYDSVVQVWRTNGSPSGTMPLGFFDMQQSFSRYAAWKNKMLIMDDFDFDNPKPVIISDGTTAGTYYLDSTLLALTGMTKIYCCNATQDKLIFSGRWTNPNGTHNGRAYISDGTAQGTKRLDAFGYFRTVVKMDSLYFLRSVNDMYVYDAVTDTTILLINNGCNGFGQVITHNNKAYIPGDEGQIYESDGTIAGTHIISTQGAGLNNYSVYLWVFDNYLYYNFRDIEHGIGLNRINLNTGVESLVVKVMDYSGAIMIPLMEKVGNRLIFPKWTSLQGLEMWGSNGPLTEIASPEVKPLSISPNPVADRLHILESEHIGEAIFQIVDNIGKVVKTGVLQPENDLMVQDLTPGVYFLHLISRRDQCVSLAKFVKI